jgi:hypothetical protein
VNVTDESTEPADTGEESETDDEPSPGNERVPQSSRRGGTRTPPRRIPPTQQARQQASASSSSQPVAQPADVVRTGSTDKHLASDEPVAPQSLPRPRSYRDLDAIPDDYD